MPAKAILHKGKHLNVLNLKVHLVLYFQTLWHLNL